MFGRSQTYDPQGRLTEQTPWQWTMQTYGKEQAETLQRDFAAMGHEILFEADGLLLYVPQFQFLEQLAGKTLDVSNGEICIR